MGRTSDRDKFRHITKFEPIPKPEQASTCIEQAPLVIKPKTKLKNKQRNLKRNLYLDLGHGYKLAYRPRSGYAAIYRIVAEHGHFAEVCEMLEKGINVYDPLEASKLLDKMLVPIEKLFEYCKNDKAWQDHAARRTDLLLRRIEIGDTNASEVLRSQTRSTNGTWSGNFAEMLSTCVGYYNWLIKHREKTKKPNRNVKKFQKAGIVFRRFPLNKNADRAYVMMFPEIWIDEIIIAIQSARGINENLYNRNAHQ